jgi:CsoR family transcriptional regulator, copper-sensing transcriptional repressor
MLQPVLGGGWVHFHAADRIGCKRLVLDSSVGHMVAAGMHAVAMHVASQIRLLVVHSCLLCRLDFLTYIPQRGMVSSMHDATKKSVSVRLKRIEGQIGGLQRMVEDNRYCVDVLTQISAIRAALHKVETEILRDHVSHCVVGAFASGDTVEQRQKIEELVDTLGRMTR